MVKKQGELYVFTVLFLLSMVERGSSSFAMKENFILLFYGNIKVIIGNMSIL